MAARKTEAGRPRWTGALEDMLRWAACGRPSGSAVDMATVRRRDKRAQLQRVVEMRRRV
jgi:hypothetical protein